MRTGDTPVPMRVYMYDLMSEALLARSSKDLLAYKCLTNTAVVFLKTMLNISFKEPMNLIPHADVWLIMDVVFDSMCDKETIVEKGYEGLVCVNI
jgi:hypothetical protein